ncbi:unnamed protein product [Effrenium voratum]|nr:unnamed protein product [Effrenium voratum]|eukprot:CAMPEP_0181423780 /NCGR_PEP_ID=MMETSP1110-20121109/14305_1 /TAXON_ID=174948 /ORGANISM="Symbiodinium sp., Strain CCMP421" /LENGTH=546 /DNA_ID=CAMNT_0023546917 /DNA_START=55 /DNA_END=1695 /DNA_ORIENTATION=-
MPRRTPEMDRVAHFLQECGLSQYTEAIRRAGFDDMETLQDIEDSHLKALGFLPGHIIKIKKRLQSYAGPQAIAASAYAAHASNASAHAAAPAYPTTRARPVLQGLSGRSPASSLTPKPKASPMAPMTPMAPQMTGCVPSDTIDAVQQSWRLIEPRVGPVAQSFYRNFFSLAPGSKVLFPMAVRNRWRDWSCLQDEMEDDFENSSALVVLWSKVVYAVGGAVAGLRNPGKLVRELHALGMRHVAYGTTEELYAVAGKALLMALASHLGPRFTPEVEAAWVNVYDFISSSAICGLQTARQTEDAVKIRLESMQVADPSKTLLVSRSRLPRDPVKSSWDSSRLGQVPSCSTIFTVQQSWAAVKELGTAHLGDMLYKHFLKLEPDTKSLFPLSVRRRYCDRTCEEDPENLEGSGMRNLFAKVVEAVGMAVAGLRNIATLVSELNALGMRHVNYNVREELFASVGEALALTLQDSMGALTEEVKEAWASSYEFFTACMISGLRFAHEKQLLLNQLQKHSSPDTDSVKNWSTSTRCSEDTTPHGRALSIEEA